MSALFRMGPSCLVVLALGASACTTHESTLAHAECEDSFTPVIGQPWEGAPDEQADTGVEALMEVRGLALDFTVLASGQVIPMAGEATIANIGGAPLEVSVEPPAWLETAESLLSIEPGASRVLSFSVTAGALDAGVDTQSELRFVDQASGEVFDAMATLRFELDEADDVCVRPTPENTGPLLTTFTDVNEYITLDEPGVYSGYRFTRPVTIAANGITIQDSIFDFRETIGSNSMVRIQNDVRCDLVIERVYATQAGMPPGKHPSFIEVTKGGENGCTAAIIRDSTFDGFWTDILGLSRDSVMEGNYLTNCELAGLHSWDSVPHGDAQQTGISSENLRIDCNTFDLPWLQDGLTPNAALEIAALGTYSDGRPHYVRNVHVVNNFFNGAGGYSLYVRARNGGLVENTSVVGNTFSTRFNNGAMSWGPDNAGSEFRNTLIADNLWEDGRCIAPSDDGGFFQHECVQGP